MGRRGQTISQDIYHDIKEGILNQVYAPEEHLVERKLAECYGVSKTPVREALTRLEKEGLVSFRSLKGATVRRMELSDILSVLDVREYLEGLAAKKAAEQGTALQTVELRNLLEESQLVVDDPATFRVFDRQFHTKILEMSRNPILSDLGERLANLFRLILNTTMTLPSRGPRAALQEHWEIFQAIGSKEGAKAEMVSRHHIIQVRQAIDRYYNSR